MALYSMPRVALARSFVVWFGIGLASKIALAVSIVFFVMLINTYTGVVNVDRTLVNCVRTMGGSGWFLTRKVLLPSTVPWILSGLRISIGFALIGAVVGEMIIAERVPWASYRLPVGPVRCHRRVRRDGGARA